MATSRSGNRTGPGRLRTTARISASTRMNTSAISMIRMFSRKPWATAGNARFSCDQAKKLLRTTGVPGALGVLELVGHGDSDGDVDDHRVDLPQREGLPRGHRGVVLADLGRGLDRVLDEVQAGGPHLRPELEGLQVGDGVRVGDGCAR